MNEILEGKEGIQLVLFKLATETYGVDISCVHEIILMQHSTPIPETPAYLEGVISLRGKIIPVINLKKYFKLPLIDVTEQTRIMVVQAQESIFGIVVDEVQEVIYISGELIEPPPPAFAGIDGGFMEGIANKGEEIIIILNAQKILDLRDQVL